MNEKYEIIHGLILAWYHFVNKLKKSLCSWNLNLSLFNEFQKVMKAQAWPGWGISIIKGPGWKHMVWQKCKHEFWWVCLGDYFNYNHTSDTVCCYYRNTLKTFWYLYIIILTINLQCWILFEPYRHFMLAAGEFIGILLLANVISLSIIFVVAFYAWWDECRTSGSSCESFWGMIGCFFMILWPGMWVAGLIISYIYWPLARKMAVYLLWQWVGIIGLAFIITISTLWFRWISYKISQIRKAFNEPE